MALTVASAFNQFDENIKPGQLTWNKVYERRDAVVKALQSAFPSTSTITYESTKIIGSLGRHTASRPVSDIDLLTHMYVDPDLWNRSYRDNSTDFLYRVRRSLNNASTVRKIGARGQAVRLFYVDGLEVDVAAVVKYDSGSYGIPDGSGNWLTTDPVKHENHLNEINNRVDGDIKKIIRFVKQWNAAHSSYFGSFHLESLVARTFEWSLGTDSRDALEYFFRHGKGNLSVHDPAGYGGDLSNGMSWTTRFSAQKAMERAWERAVAANRAEIGGDYKEALRLWRIVLGEKFPT
ncbi:SMODS domain-containing nucleotidyltransferase [Streptomyces nigrescens]|uniref:SMODS domain-containing nucleotidyltransferase n=1 Tax=Streptomyces nigrescens TaxID=1920 RepID=UPI0036F976DB